jgi:MFS superfamily sulfate permease-like transporter
MALKYTSCRTCAKAHAGVNGQFSLFRCLRVCCCVYFLCCVFVCLPVSVFVGLLVCWFVGLLGQMVGWLVVCVFPLTC